MMTKQEQRVERRRIKREAKLKGGRSPGHTSSRSGSLRFSGPARYVKRRRPRKWLSKRDFFEKTIKRLRARPTGSEVEFMKKLDELGVLYTFQWEFEHKGYWGIADFYLWKYNLVIEVDGGYHKNQLGNDAVRDEVLRKHMNHRVLRLENRDAREIDLKELRYLIEFKAA